MKLNFSLKAYFIWYYLLLMVLYTYKIKTYFYWKNIAGAQDTFFDFSLGRVTVATLLFAVNLHFIGKLKYKRFNFITLCLFFLLLTIPSLISFTSKNMYPLKLVFYHQILFYALYYIPKIRLSFEKVPRLNKKQTLFFFFFLVTIGIIPYLYVYGPDINLKNLFLIDVYKTRTNMAKLSNPYFGYTYSLFTRIVIPLLIVYAVELKNKLLVLLGIIYLLLFYLFGAHKTVYLGLIVVLIFYKWSYLQTINRVLKYSILFILLCVFLALLSFDYPWILTFRRIHFLPALLDICYLDFFDENYLYWSESVLKRFIEYPYEISHTKVIGREYFGNANVGANNGLISDGYMNYGTIGVVLNILLVSFYFMVLNNLKIPSKYFGVYLLVVFSFLSSSTLTVFLTHGAIALLLISIFLLSEKTKRKIPV